MKAIIEIPKGDNRRRHIKPDKSGFVDLGPLVDVIPVNNGIMLVHYGYIPETINESDGDEIDVLVLSDYKVEVGQEIEVEPIAIVQREDKDDKIVAVDLSRKATQTWSDVLEDEKKFINDFFGYHHKIISIKDAACAKKYLEEGHQLFLRKQ